jgi:hypothetical protein
MSNYANWYDEVQGVKLARRDEKTATMELTSSDWSVIILALQEAQTRPRKSAELAEMLAELVEVQTGKN